MPYLQGFSVKGLSVTARWHIVGQGQRLIRLCLAARKVIDAHADEEDLCMECGCDQCEATRAAVAHLKAAMEGGGK